MRVQGAIASGSIPPLSPFPSDEKEERFFGVLTQGGASVALRPGLKMGRPYRTSESARSDALSRFDCGSIERGSHRVRERCHIPLLSPRPSCTSDWRVKCATTFRVGDL